MKVSRQNTQAGGPVSDLDRAVAAVDLVSPAGGVRPGIPKLIHQTAWKPAAMPQLLRENVAALIRRNPGWTHCLYGDKDIEGFIREQYGSAVLSQYWVVPWFLLLMSRKSLALSGRVLRRLLRH